MDKTTIRNIILFLVLIIAGFVYVTFFQTDNFDIKTPVAKIDKEPYQKKIKERIPFKFKEFTITPLAEFKIKARVLSKHRYRYGKEAKLSPMDLALGWGKMSQKEVLKDIKISQHGRWYYWRTSRFSIPRREIETHSANMHIIPANKEVRKKLLQVKKWDIVYIEGKLVRVDAKNWYWVSSLTRKDIGGGSCEVVWADKIVINPTD